MRWRRPDLRTLFQVSSVLLAITTLVLVILYLIDRSHVREQVRAGLLDRLTALEERIETLVEAEAAYLESIEPAREGVPPDVAITYDQKLDFGTRVGNRNLYTAVLLGEEPVLFVAIEEESEGLVWRHSRLALETLVDAMADFRPEPRGRVYLTTGKGIPVVRWPDEDHSAPRTSHQKFRRSTEAFDQIALGATGVTGYRDLDDRDAVGAYRYSGILHGGIVVEQLQQVAYAEVRGIQHWHVSGTLLALSLLALLFTYIVPRIRFTGDLFRLYAYAKKYWPIIALVFLVMLAYASGNMARLALLKVVFDDVLLGKGAGAAEALKWVLVVFSIIVVVMAASSWLKEYMTQYVTQAIVNDIRVDLARRMLGLDMQYFDRQKSGEIMSRLSNDVNQTRKSLSLIFGEIFQEPLMLLGALGAAFYTNWRLTLLIFVGLPLIVLPIAKLGRLVKKYSKRRQVQRGVVTEVLMQSVSGVRTVKAFQMEAHEVERLRKASTRLLKQSVKVGRTVALSKTLIDLMNSVGALLITAIGGYMVIYGIAGASAPDLMTLTVIMAQMYKPVKDLTKAYNNIQESMAGAERIFEMMDEKSTVVDRPGAIELVRPERSIAFENVSFAYDDTPVLKNISFRASVGEVVALVGETGAGKSTLTDLVARFYDPTEGRVTIDGEDLKSYRIASLRRAISTVSQDAFLFNASVRENIGYGRPGATDEEIEEAARSAGIHDEIVKMDRGYQSLVGERGTRLSGGQRQRLTIARALLKDAPILILDEATSALDSETEALVQEALKRLMMGRTTFVIAHRLSTIGHADRILVLKEGELVEEGTHQELLGRTGGIYRTLHRLQFAGA